MQHNKLVVSNTLGTFLEYFDYTLYGFSAPLIAHLFFPSHDRASSMLMAWAAFSISFIVRPFGAILLGHLGDRLGRRNVLAACIALMALPTCLIGLLPTYAHVGIMAPIALVCCRILQGFAISGEFAGCSVYLYESGLKYKGFLASLTTCASGFGMLAASLWIFSFNYFQLSEHLVNHNYWRLPFIIAGLSIGIIGFYLRRLMPETPEFTEWRDAKKILKQPFLQILKTAPFKFLICILLAGYTTFATYTLFLYMANYIHEQLHYSLETGLLVTALVGFIESLAAPYFAYLSDLYGRVKVMCLGTCAMVILAIPLMHVLQTASLTSIIFSLSILAICLATFDGPMMAYVLDIFPVGERYSALGVSYNLGVGILGGLAPLLLTFLIMKTHNPIVPGYFLAGLASLTLFALGILHSIFQKRERLQVTF